MLRIENMSISHKKDLRLLVPTLNLNLAPGAKAAIIGEEGSGKSTLLKLLVNPKLIESYAEYTGTFHIGGQVGYLAQELSEDEKKLGIQSFFEENPYFYTLTPNELYTLGAPFGFAPEFFFSSRQVGQLSGGEQVKLRLAKALLGGPSVLLLDEPSNDLDIPTLRWLESFINSCQIPVLYISHDEVLLERTANMVVHIEHVRHRQLARCTVASLPYMQYMQSRGPALAKQEKAARKEAAENKKQAEKLQQIYKRVDHEQATISRSNPGGGRLLKKKMKTVKAQERRLDKVQENATKLPDIETAIAFTFPAIAELPRTKQVLQYNAHELLAGGRCLARNIELTVIGPQKICVIGPNGMGKTTLLKQLAAAVQSGVGINAAYMPQNYAELLPGRETPTGFLAPGGSKSEITAARTALGNMQFTPDEMGHLIFDLSGGQKAKLLLLYLAKQGCNLLFLDEPTRNFSPLSAPVIRSALAGFSGAIVSVSHDRKYIEEVCDTVYSLTENGLVLEDKNELIAL